MGKVPFGGERGLPQPLEGVPAESDLVRPQACADEQDATEATDFAVD